MAWNRGLSRRALSNQNGSLGFDSAFEDYEPNVLDDLPLKVPVGRIASSKAKPGGAQPNTPRPMASGRRLPRTRS
jgi:hypothetical protein